MVWEKLLSKEEALASSITLDPQNAFYRATLANFYFKEGMETEGIVEANQEMQGSRNKTRLAVCCTGHLSFLPKKRLHRPTCKRARNAVDIEGISFFV